MMCVTLASVAPKTVGTTLPPTYYTTGDQVSPSATLYCFVLVMPSGYEIPLMASIYAQRSGVFACEAYEIFSNDTLPIADGLQTIGVPGYMQVEYGGRWKRALNTDVFIGLWKSVRSSGRYKLYDWSIKADPDTVFFPARFRTLVTRRSADKIPGPLVPPGAVFLNNCQFGLHGPLEAVSREGMVIFLQDIDDCQDIRQAAMDLFPDGIRPELLSDRDYAFGEDQYLRRCLKKLSVQMVNEYESFLSEKVACFPHTTDCSMAKVAFHAYKSPDDWARCQSLALESGSWPGEAKASTTAPPPGAYLTAAALASTPRPYDEGFYEGGLADGSRHGPSGLEDDAPAPSAYPAAYAAANPGSAAASAAYSATAATAGGTVEERVDAPAESAAAAQVVATVAPYPDDSTYAAQAEATQEAEVAQGDGGLVDGAAKAGGALLDNAKLRLAAIKGALSGLNIGR